MPQSSEVIFDKLLEILPPIFTREEAAKHLGGILTAKSLNNIDFLKQGPSVRCRIGKKIAYERENFVKWLKEYQHLVPCDA